MSGSFTELFFNRLKGTDIDYLISCQKVGKNNIITTSYKFIPNDLYASLPNEPYWDNINTVIDYCLKDGWTEIDIYDLYSPFETALIKTIKSKR